MDVEGVEVGNGKWGTSMRTIIPAEAKNFMSRDMIEF